jgi:hypothetical protein
MFEVWYILPNGKHECKVCTDEPALIAYASRLRREARILVHGQHVGRVWKDGSRWQWFYDPDLVKTN